MVLLDEHHKNNNNNNNKNNSDSTRNIDNQTPRQQSTPNQNKQTI